jgi:hypothetical protein
VVEVLEAGLEREAVGDGSFCGERSLCLIAKICSRSINLRASGDILEVFRFRRFKIRIRCSGVTCAVQYYTERHTFIYIHLVPDLRG